MAPIVDGLASKHEAAVSVRKINANYDDAAGRLNVLAVPTYVLLDVQGNVIDRLVGGSIDDLERLFEKATSLQGE